MSQGFSTKTRDLIEQRDQVCVLCGMPGREKHHRRRRRENHDGLAHDPSNGVLLCGWGNHSGCHGKVHSNPEWARERGLILRPDESPLEVPIRHYSRGRVLLDSAGGWVKVSSPSPQRIDEPRR